MSDDAATPAKVRLTAGLGPLVEAEMAEYSDGAYADHGSARDQLKRFAAAVQAAEREQCAMKLQVTRADVSIAAGELSEQEWRTCAAVLRWMQARIRA